MYNLLVSGNDESWIGDPWIIEESRCVREYTDKEITEKLGAFTQEQVDQIRRMPCIFAYETGCRKDPLFGLIRGITKRQGKVRIEYEIIDAKSFVSHDDLLKMTFELDITDWELNRTHWAIKNVNLQKELMTKGVQLPGWVQKETKSVDVSKHHFDVALSFPGEHRKYVEGVAKELERLVGPNAYFYDANYKAQLARPSLDILLQDIYRNRASLVVIFLCQSYQEKEWCGIEFRAIREIIKNKQNEKVMFIKMDTGKVEGVFETDGYIDAGSHTPEEIAKFIKERFELLPQPGA